MGIKNHSPNEDELQEFSNLIQEHRNKFKENPRRRLYKFEDSFSYIYPGLSYLWDKEWEIQPWEIRAGSDVQVRIKCKTCKNWRTSRTSRIIRTDLCKECYGKDKSFRAKRSEAMSKIHSDTNKNRSRIEKIIKANKSEKRRKEQSDRYLKLWADSNYRERRIKELSIPKTTPQRESRIQAKGKIRLDQGDIPISNTNPDLAELIIWETIYIPDFLFSNSRYLVKFKCKTCRTNVEKYVNNFIKSPYCEKCYINNFVSHDENTIAERLRENGYTVRQSVRNLIKNPITKKALELDIYLPKLKIAIEFNGDYWHSDKFLINQYQMNAKEYHINKKHLCEEKNIKLLYIWESDWNNDKSLIWNTLIQYLSSDKEVVIPEIFDKMTGVYDKN